MSVTEERKNDNFLIEFYKSRTPLWTSIIYLLIEAIIPGIILWIFVGIDFSGVTVVNKLPNPHFAYAVLICFGYLLFVVCFVMISFFLKAHKSDNFTYSFMVAVIFIALTLLSYGLTKNTITFIFLKFIICFALLILSGIGGVFITSLFANINYKIEEDKQKVLEKNQNGEELSKKELKILKTAKKENEQQKLKDLKSEEIKRKIDEKLNKIIDDQKKDKEKDS